jgi:hypothetical protein
MRIVWTVVAATVVAVFLAAGCKCSCMEKQHKAKTNVVYVCPDCHMMALSAGKCHMCKKDMTQMHLLGTKDGMALMCGCGADCKCDAKGIKDGKCACGKEVMKVSAKGMYVCPMGCAEISAMPGKCACGMEMKKVE